MRTADATSALVLTSSARTLRASTVAARHRKHHRRRTPQQIAWHIMHWFKWKRDRQFRYLKWLWERESSWNVHATNPYSGAYGIPQAVPGVKMASCGRNWRWSAWTQIRWGMRYIKRTYRSPRRAWRHEVDYGWY
ncbi:MAG TPA: lytic transglycosylase domain-containing protein [Streptosporangiaceae bacterium]|nr:lytic transglycosylase domain-containing protein [Streptosporangiaceae bacterium]